MYCHCDSLTGAFTSD